MSRKLLTDAAFLPLGSQENRPFVNGSSVSAGGRGTAEAVLSCQLLPFQPKPEPSLPKPPNLEARLKLKFLLPAPGPQRSIWAISLIHCNSRGVLGTPLLHKHTQPFRHCRPQPPARQAPQRCSQTLLILTPTGTTRTLRHTLAGKAAAGG